MTHAFNPSTWEKEAGRSMLVYIVSAQGYVVRLSQNRIRNEEMDKGHGASSEIPASLSHISCLIVCNSALIARSLVREVN